MQKNPTVDLSVGLCLVGSERDLVLWPLFKENYDVHLCESNISPVHTFLVRMSVVRQIGFFRTDLRHCEDYNYWLRCMVAGKKCKSTTGAIVFYRQHADSATNKRSKHLYFDAVQHFEISKCLRSEALFPVSGKYLGWLACSAGCLELVFALPDEMQEMRQNLLAAAGLALENALNHKEDIVEQQKLLLAKFYLLKALLYMNILYSDLPEVTKKAFAKLLRIASTLACLPLEDVRVEERNLFSMLCYDEYTLEKSLKNKYMALQKLQNTVRC